MRVLGIDFGTSNTVGMLRLPDGRLEPLLFDGSPLLPSAVYLDPEGRMLIGRDAHRHARIDPSRFEPNPKRRIDDGSIYLGDRELPVAAVFGQVLGHVATEARRQLGGPPQEVRLTHPARWAERRRGVLVEAARIAGLGTPKLVAEPVGAASYFTAVLRTQVPVGHSLAIYDLGGGTFDATVVRRTPTGFDVLAEEGLPDVGGLDLDHAVVEHLGATFRASHGEQWQRLINPTEAGDRRARRMLYDDVRGAKEMLSRTTSADLHLPALEVDAHLTREEFETLVRPYLERTVECLRRVIADAKVEQKELLGVFLVGGSSRIPLAARLIHTTLGIAPTTLEQPETVVVEGVLCLGGPSAGNPRVPTSVPPAGGPRPPAGPHPPNLAPPSSGPRPPAGPFPPNPARGPVPPTGPRTPPQMPGPQYPPGRPPVRSAPSRPPGPMPAPARSAGFGPTGPGPMAPAANPPRPWYAQPAVIVTGVVVAVVLVLCLGLLLVAGSG
jgi:molecular chaperone DnaK (HSP70)